MESDIPAGDGKTANLFYSVYANATSRLGGQVDVISAHSYIHIIKRKPWAFSGAGVGGFSLR